MTLIVYKDQTLYADNSGVVDESVSDAPYYKPMEKFFTDENIAIAFTGKNINFDSKEFIHYIKNLKIKLKEAKDKQLNKFNTDCFTNIETVDTIKAIIITAEHVYGTNDLINYNKINPENTAIIGLGSMYADTAINICGQSVEKAYEITSKMCACNYITKIHKKHMIELKPIE